MKITHVSVELAPIAKVGGLADVVYGLSRAQIEQGLDVVVIMPKYDFLDLEMTHHQDFSCTFGGVNYNNSLWKSSLDGIPLLLIDSQHPRMWFSRGVVYGCKDDPERFLYFTRAVYEYLINHAPPDILHLHDWHVSALAYLTKNQYKSVITIHNFYHQGKCDRSLLKMIGITPQKNILDDAQPLKVNLLKCGIVYSDRVNTVSPTYSKEVLKSKMGYGLERTLQSVRKKFTGILNGIDFDYWDPKTDPILSFNYNHDSLDRRKEIKQQLCDRFDMKHDERPLVGIITRLVPQKGVQLIEDLVKKIEGLEGQLILLGSSPFPDIEEIFEELAQKKSKHVHLHLKYDEELSHLLYGASDFLAVPSLFEPCGLTQLIALRYGSVPIVRKTGGLADTVKDNINGFVFEDATPSAFRKAVKRAFNIWYQDKDKFKEMQLLGMSEDYSWKVSATHYLDMYHEI